MVISYKLYSCGAMELVSCWRLDYETPIYDLRYIPLLSGKVGRWEHLDVACRKQKCEGEWAYETSPVLMREHSPHLPSPSPPPPAPPIDRPLLPSNILSTIPHPILVVDDITATTLQFRSR
jgi:hypothetical protein